MSELRVVAEIKAKPGSEDTIRTALVELTGATQSDPGCISYELFESAAVPGTFFTIESWVDQDSLDAHMQSPHIAAALAIAGDHVAVAPSIHPLMPVTD